MKKFKITTLLFFASFNNQDGVAAVNESKRKKQDPLKIGNEPSLTGKVLSNQN